MEFVSAFAVSSSLNGVMGACFLVLGVRDVVGGREGVSSLMSSSAPRSWNSPNDDDVIS